MRLFSIVLLSVTILVSQAFPLVPYDPLYKSLLKPLQSRQQYYLILEEPEPQPNKIVKIKRSIKRSIPDYEEPFELSANAVKRKILARIGKRQVNPARVGK